MCEVSIKLDERHDAGDVINELKEKGFKLVRSLDAIGVLIGTCPDPMVGKLLGIKGVQAIEKNRTDYGPCK